MILYAEVTDPTHLTLQSPIALPLGSRLIVEVREPSAEHAEFVDASALLLERAYGEDEPDYSEAGEKATVNPLACCNNPEFAALPRPLVLAPRPDEGVREQRTRTPARRL